MKKRFVSILLVAAMTASLAACGGSNGGDNSASATEKGERQRVHLTVVRSHLQSRPSS